jgi:hypothetical protein
MRPLSLPEYEQRKEYEQKFYLTPNSLSGNIPDMPET